MALIKEGLPVLAFVSATDFEHWLSIHHSSSGVWIKIATPTSHASSITYEAALCEALCYGWIDGRQDCIDDTYFLQKFTPRRPDSLWSTRNINTIAALTARGKMRIRGLIEVEAAKRDGRWTAAYASSKGLVFPEDFLVALEKSKQAQTFFNTLSKSDIYAIAKRLSTASTQAMRRRRFAALLMMLERGKFR